MNCHVIQTEQFKADVRAAIYYLSVTLSNPDATDALLDELEKAKESVSMFPFSMPSYPSAKRRETYRTVDVRGWLAFYVVLGDTVEFRRFLHAAADLPLRLPQ